MIPYPIHVAILLAACLLFYKLLLQNQTYYQLNRLILLACLLLSFALPLVQVPRAISFRGAPPMQDIVVATPAAPVQDPAKTTLAISSVNEATPQNTQSAQSPSVVTQFNFNKVDILKWAMWLYWAGCLIFAANFLLQITVLLYQSYKKPVIADGSYRIVEIDEDKAPCSFGNSIFINPTKYDWETYQQILLHEKVHIQQRHTVDLVLAELMLILQWFNPFAWYYRKEVENNLEFLTDDAIISQHKVAPEAYQLSLLKVSVPNYAMHITTNYNQSLLKRRILMMNTKQSNIHTSWKYFMLVPVLAVLVCGLNQQAVSSSSVATNKKLKTSHQPESKTSPAETKALPGTVANPIVNVNTTKHIAPATLPGADTDMEDALSAKPTDLNLLTFIQDNAELMKHGEFKKVLQRHIWYHNHALEYNPALTGVRLSFALSDWKKLADMYPPALRAMQKIRDNKTKEVARNASSGLFMDVAALNRTLGEDGKTLELFKILEAKRPEAAAACFHWVKPALFAANQYNTISKYLGDPLKEFEVILNTYNSMERMSNMPIANENANFKALRDSTIHKAMAKNLVAKSMELIQYAVAIKDMKSAKEIQQKALTLVKDDRLNHALDH